MFVEDSEISWPLTANKPQGRELGCSGLREELGAEAALGQHQARCPPLVSTLALPGARVEDGVGSAHAPATGSRRARYRPERFTDSIS